LLRHLVICIAAWTSAAALLLSASSPVVWVAALLSGLSSVICVVIRHWHRSVVVHCWHCGIVVCIVVRCLRRGGVVCGCVVVIVFVVSALSALLSALLSAASSSALLLSTLSLSALLG
jgi:hypothetical protein